MLQDEFGELTKSSSPFILVESASSCGQSRAVKILFVADETTALRLSCHNPIFCTSLSTIDIPAVDLIG